MRMFDDTIASIRRPGELSVWQRLALIATRVPKTGAGLSCDMACALQVI